MAGDGSEEEDSTASMSNNARATVLKPGGPCCVCGATLSSTWYGRKNGNKYCRSNPCKGAGGYAVGKKKKSKRRADDGDSDGGDSAHTSIYKITKVEACLGLRCACKHATLRVPAACTSDVHTLTVRL